MGALNLLFRATPTTACFSAVVKVIKLINWSTIETCKNMAGTMEVPLTEPRPYSLAKYQNRFEN